MMVSGDSNVAVFDVKEQEFREQWLINDHDRITSAR